MTTRRHAALTLVEVLVVMAILSVLVLLLLPAVNAAREAGRRTQCMNNQRNLVLSMVHYESAHLSFPPGLPSCSPHAYNSLGREQGVDCVGPNWAMQVLSLMEEAERLPVAGKIIWITPVGAEGNRAAGIGVQFSDQDGGQARNKIEGYLGGSLSSDRQTHTM